MPEDNTSRVAVVTGAAGGIGAATARRLSAAGMYVVLVDKDADRLAATASDLPRERTVSAPVDLAEADAAARVRHAVPSHWSEVAVLINNAGISPKRHGQSPGLEQTDDALWEQVIAVNLTVAFRMCREFAPGMRSRGYGRIVNIASMAARTSNPVAGPSYMASKAGVLGLTRHIAGAYAEHGVTANCICPGRIATPMATTSPPEVNVAALLRIPVRRLGTPEEVACAVEFLAAESSGFITGAVLDVNGGGFMG